MRQHVAQKVAQVVAAHHDIIDNRERFRGIVFRNAFHDAREDVCTGQAQGFLDIFSTDFRAGETNHLIESRLRVAHRAIAGARNFANCFIRNRNLFRIGNQPQALGDFRRGNGAELEKLAA